MISLQTIEEEIQNLPEQDFILLREWFQNFDSKKWDDQIETDAKSGKLDDLVNSAMLDFKNGKYKAIWIITPLHLFGNAMMHYQRTHRY